MLTAEIKGMKAEVSFIRQDMQKLRERTGGPRWLGGGRYGAIDVGVEAKCYVDGSPCNAS